MHSEPISKLRLVAKAVSQQYTKQQVSTVFTFFPSTLKNSLFNAINFPSNDVV